MHKIGEVLADLWVGILVTALGFVALFIFNHYGHFGLTGLFGTFVYYAIYLSPFWLVPVLAVALSHLWLDYVRFSGIVEQDTVLLEIKLPREITKSPAAMEVFFTALYQTGAASYLETYWVGKIRPWFSCELVSLGGEVKFYLWTPAKFRNLVENQLYGQYPTIEVYEAEDYTHAVTYQPDKMFLWGTYYKLSKDNVYPIKTYIDYGLDKDPKEEFKIDPLTAVLEYLGSMRPGEQVWIQILIQAHKKEGLQEGRLIEKPNWKGQAEKEIEKIREKATPPPTVGKDGQKFASFPNPTKGQIETIAALERSVSKFPFETAIRGFYIADLNVFNPIGITGLIGSVRQYSSESLNGFKLGWFTDHDDLGKDVDRMFRFIPAVARYMDERVHRFKREFLEAYKMRSFFQLPYKHFHRTPFILNTEELATIFHFPGLVATTPNLAKIESKRGEPPVNLPR